jgi:hypothetical protein
LLAEIHGQREDAIGYGELGVGCLPLDPRTEYESGDPEGTKLRVEVVDETPEIEGRRCRGLES